MQASVRPRHDFTVFVDFDSTLYDTRAFSEKLSVRIALKAGISVGQAKADGAAYRTHPDLGGYEYQKHLADYGLNPADMWRELAEVTQTDFLYPDSAGFFRGLQSDGYNPKILSFGEKRFQLAKIQPTLSRLAVSAGDIDIIIVDDKKAGYITMEHKGQRGVLVDDKPGQQLPPGFTEIHLDRQRCLGYPLINGNIIIVSNLSQARTIINSLQESAI